MLENNNLVFKTFDEAKRYLIANPGGSIVRLDNNQGFNIKYPNKNVEAQTQPSSVQEIKARDNDDLPYTEDELKDTDIMSGELKGSKWIEWDFNIILDRVNACW